MNNKKRECDIERGLINREWGKSGPEKEKVYGKGGRKWKSYESEVKI